jgi:hypothetical protein
MGEIITLVIVLVLLCLVIYIIETLLPFDPVIRRIIEVIILLCVLLWVLRHFALVHW